MSDFQAETPIFTSLVAERRTLLGVLGASLVLGALYTLLVPAIWEASTTIVFPVASPSILGNTGIGGTASGLAALAGGATPLRVYGGLLDSQRMREYVAKQTGIKPRDVKDMTQVMDQATESTLTITARDRAPKLAKRVVALHLEELALINRDLSVPLSGDDSRAIGVQLDQERAKLRDLESRLLAFSRDAKTAPSVTSTSTFVMPGASRWAEMQKGLEIDKQRVDAALSASRSRLGAVARSGGGIPVESPTVTQWRDRLGRSEYDLQVALLTLSPQAPEVEKLRAKVNLAKAGLASELGNYVQAAGLGIVGASDKEKEGLPDLLIQQAGLDAQLAAVRRLVAEAPSESITLSHLTREVATEGAVVAQLQTQYSLASLQSVRNPQRWQVLDAPEVAEKPVNKSFSKNVASAGLLGLALGTLAALFQAKRRRPASTLSADAERGVHTREAI